MAMMNWRSSPNRSISKRKNGRNCPPRIDSGALLAAGRWYRRRGVDHLGIGLLDPGFSRITCPG
jgi:hypothetical protein